MEEERELRLHATTRVFRLDLEDSPADATVVCDVATHFRAPGALTYQQHGFFQRMALLQTNTLSRLEVRGVRVP